MGSKLSFLFNSISKYVMKGFLSTKGSRFHWARGYGLVQLYLAFVAGAEISSKRSLVQLVVTCENKEERIIKG